MAVNKAFHTNNSTSIQSEKNLYSDLVKEAIQISNHTKYGLAASIWTDDLNEAYKYIRNVEAGIVHVNCYGEDDNSVPFGGVKESGFGKDKSFYAFKEYSVTKTTWFNIDD